MFVQGFHNALSRCQWLVYSSSDNRVHFRTGAAGYFGTELTKQLLDRGYTVRATVRKASRETPGHLEDLAQALPGKLEVHEADLLEQGSFDSVVQGAKYVYATNFDPYFCTDELYALTACTAKNSRALFCQSSCSQPGVHEGL